VVSFCGSYVYVCSFLLCIDRYVAVFCLCLQFSVAKGGPFGYLDKGLVGRDRALEHLGGQLLSLFSFIFLLDFYYNFVCFENHSPEVEVVNSVFIP
jgi:hypothetical protein